eukprot:gene4830-8677_t
MNSEAYEECMKRARSHRNAGQFENALKFAKKASNMKGINTSDATSLVKNIEASMKGNQNERVSTDTSQRNTDREPQEGLRKRATIFSRTKQQYSEETSSQGGTKRKYTEEQVKIVCRVLESRDLYQRLGVDRNVETSSLKRAFRKLALQVHPDKNPAPRADQAFKSVNKAYEILSDPGKRRHYDMTGQEETRSPSIANRDPFTDMGDPFEFFFGNMQPRNFRVYTNGPGFHAFHRNARYQQRQRAQETQEAPHFSALLLTGLFFFLFILLGSVAPGNDASSVYSFSPSRHFHIPRETRTKIPIQYFVHNAFESQYLGNSSAQKRRLKSLETAIYEDYIRLTEAKCYHERKSQPFLNRKTRNSGNERKDITSSCDLLRKLLAARTA